MESEVASVSIRWLDGSDTVQCGLGERAWRAKTEWLLLVLVTARVAGSQAEAAPKHSPGVADGPRGKKPSRCGRKGVGKRYSQSGILRRPDGWRSGFGFVP